MNYLLVAGGAAVAYYIWMSMNKKTHPGYSGGVAHLSEDGFVPTYPPY
jgi:hypothetical protein